MNWVEQAIEAELGYPVDWDATGTWVGAIGTVAAIVFAVIIPLHVRSREAKDRVQHAINNAVVLCGLLQSQWEGLVHVLQHNEFSEGSVDLFQSRVVAARALAGQIPHSVLLGAAFGAVSQLSMSVETFAGVLNKLAAADDVADLAKQFPFPDVISQNEETAEVLKTLRAYKVQGFWMIAAPDEVDLIRSQGLMSQVGHAIASKLRQLVPT